jgi:hypothetical protein
LVVGSAGAGTYVARHIVPEGDIRCKELRVGFLGGEGKRVGQDLWGNVITIRDFATYY